MSKKVYGERHGNRRKANPPAKTPWYSLHRKYGRRERSVSARKEAACRWTDIPEKPRQKAVKTNLKSGESGHPAAKTQAPVTSKNGSKQYRVS